MREALARLFNRRMAWLWLLFEPVFHVAYLMFMFTVIRIRQVGGIETALWIMVGLLAYFLFRRTFQQTSGAIGSNFTLFVYRQVKPVDTILVRGILEGALAIVVSIVLCCGAALFGVGIVPADPLAVLQAALGMWLIGLGFGAMVSVAVELTPEFGKMLAIAMRPLYLISGVIFPISRVPQPYRDWLMFNPLAHGVEAARLGFAPYYHAVPELSISYMYWCALIMIFSGLLLQVGFAKRMVTQ